MHWMWSGEFFIISLLTSLAKAKFSPLSQVAFGPRENVWVTLARNLNTTTFYDNLAAPGSPFITCLIGVPLNESTWNHFNECKTQFLKKWNVSPALEVRKNISKRFDSYDKWDDRYPIGPEPQEIDLVDSLNASYCLYFNDSKKPCNDRIQAQYPCNTIIPTIVSPLGSQSDWERNWCKKIVHSCTNPISGSTYPHRLPSGWFLICGNRAWAGIPTRPRGGPCTFGQLSLALPQFHPNKTNPIRQFRRELQTLSNKCDDNVQLWNKVEIIFGSLFVPGASAAKAHRNLEKLSCWVVKQANSTSKILSELADDLSKVQHAVLQNQVAIDFLLLAHGHGCEDFEGLCCMDLQDHSRSIHKDIQQLMDHSQKIKQDVGFFGLEGLTNWFNVNGWLKSLLQSALLALIVVMISIACIGCVISCIHKGLDRIVAPAWIVQRQTGGIVKDFLEDRGHNLYAVNNPVLDMTKS